MNFGFTQEQELLRAEVRKFLDQNATLEDVRSWGETEAGYSPELWRHMAELGWVGLTLPEAYGGAGLDLVTLVVLLEEAGRTLLPSPLISTLMASRAILLAGDDAQKTRWLPELAQGKKIGTLAYVEDNDGPGPEGVRLAGKADGDGFRLSGIKRHVPDAVSADLFVVAFRGEGDEISLAVIGRDQDGVGVDSHPAMDASKPTGSLSLSDVVVEPGAVLASASSTASVFAHLLDVGATAVTAEAVGVAEGAHATTTQFAKQRVQFDQVIGTYQGVKHPLAEMFVDIESFKSLVYYAAWALDEGSEGASSAASRAKAYASEVLPRLGIDCVQLHGGVGYTWEYDIQLYLKRSKWFRPAFGDADYHYERIAMLGGL